VDSRGRLAQYGNVPEKEGGAIYVVPLRPSCPTWQVEVHSSLLNNLRSGWATIIVGGALIFLLIASLFAGGFLFARDAARERRDALQKTTFVANVSHELKTPLTNVRLYAELLADGHAKTPEAQQQYLGIIVTESERLTRLINNVLDFGRLEQQRRAFHLETINMEEWLRSTVHALQGITDDAEMAVTVSCPPGLCVQVDRDALSQVFLNVIDNACKYAKAGKVIDIAAEPAAGNRAALSISDRGDGLESRHAQRIFQRFFRVDDSTTASVGGCGLGLSIARQLMQGMGGDIRWTPRDGGGSTFVLTMKTADFPASNH
jgi:signal transduction histidine kinase